MCIRILSYIYIYLHIYKYTYAHMHLYTCVLIFTCICAHIYTHVHTLRYMTLHVCIQTYVRICVYMCIYTRNKQMKVRHGRTQLHAERGIGSIMGGSGSLRHSNERSARALRLRTPCVRKLHAHRTYMSHVLNIHLYLNFLLACSNVCFPVPCLRSRVMVFVFSEFVVVCLCFPIFGLKSTLVCC